VQRLHDDHGVHRSIKTHLIPLWGLAFLAGCSHPGPILDFGTPPPRVGGTVSGIVRTTDSSITAENRHVTVTNVRTSTRYEAQTAVDGGYTIQVPEGTYHIEVALEPGELYARRPENTHIDKGDLDLHLDFVIAAK
jgi:Carboxypeptidase regulatory-like domain